MMLDLSFGESEAARAVESAVETALKTTAHGASGRWATRTRRDRRAVVAELRPEHEPIAILAALAAG